MPQKSPQRPLVALHNISSINHTQAQSDEMFFSRWQSGRYILLKKLILLRQQLILIYSPEKKKVNHLLFLLLFPLSRFLSLLNLCRAPFLDHRQVNEAGK